MSSYLKTKESNDNVLSFINGINNETQKQDAMQLLTMMEGITGLEARMWGASMIGFGKYEYKTKAGKVGEWFLIGFSPRKNNLSLHLMYGLEDETELLNKLGRHSIGKGCLYIKKLYDVDCSVLTEIMENTYKRMLESSK